MVCYQNEQDTQNKADSHRTSPMSEQTGHTEHIAIIRTTGHRQHTACWKNTSSTPMVRCLMTTQFGHRVHSACQHQETQRIIPGNRTLLIHRLPKTNPATAWTVFYMLTKSNCYIFTGNNTTERNSVQCMLAILY